MRRRKSRARKRKSRTFPQISGRRTKELHNVAAERLKLVARLSVANNDPETAYRAYSTLLNTLDADDWEAYLGIIDVAVSIGGAKVEEVRTMFENLEAETSGGGTKRRLRGPSLSHIALANRVLDESNSSNDEVSRLREAIQRYVDIFGCKPCCFGDLKTFLMPFVHHVSNDQEDQSKTGIIASERALLVTYLTSHAAANSPGDYSARRMTTGVCC